MLPILVLKSFHNNVGALLILREAIHSQRARLLMHVAPRASRSGILTMAGIHFRCRFVWLRSILKSFFCRLRIRLWRKEILLTLFWNRGLRVQRGRYHGNVVTTSAAMDCDLQDHCPQGYDGLSTGFMTKSVGHVSKPRGTVKLGSSEPTPTEHPPQMNSY